MNNSSDTGLTRRDFVRASASAVAIAAAGGLAMAGTGSYGATARGAGRLKVGVIGCGGRGTGAASDSLSASPDVEIVALADVFPERVESARKELKGMSDLGPRVTVADSMCFTGFDAYKQLLATDVDIVILATPPHFRPIHFEAAVAAGKHIFFEKPVAVDPAGVRKVIEAARLAETKKLCVVTGTQRRHEKCYLEAMKRLNEGQIGKIVAGRCYWNQGGLWMHDRQPEWSDMEWQLRNWLYFAWLSGDHIVEQHVHNLDVMNWAMGSHPVRASGMGGRQSRTAAAYGHIFDHFAIEYVYPNGATVSSQCRQADGCSLRVEEVVVGTEGQLITASGSARIEGSRPWKLEGDNPNPYVDEHRDLINAIKSGAYINEGVRIAESTLTAIMGRMSAYTGKALTWDQAMQSKLDLSPAKYEFGPIPTPEIAIPGRTPLI